MDTSSCSCTACDKAKQQSHNLPTLWDLIWPLAVGLVYTFGGISTAWQRMG